MREGLARQHLVSHGCVVDEDGFYRRGLLEVAGLEALVDVLVGVVGAGFVVERVLDELEAGDSYRVEERWSVPPVLRRVSVVTPRSLRGSIHWAKMGATRVFSWR